GQASLITVLFLLQLATALSVDGNPGIQFLRIPSGEFGVETNPHACQELLGIRSLDAAWFELFRTDLAIEQRGSDQVFQIVVGLLFGLWLIFATEGSAARDIVTALEDIALDAIDVTTRQPMSPLQLQCRLQHRLAVDQRAELLQDGLFHNLQGWIIPN